MTPWFQLNCYIEYTRGIHMNAQRGSSRYFIMNADQVLNHSLLSMTFCFYFPWRFHSPYTFWFMNYARLRLSYSNIYFLILCDLQNCKATLFIVVASITELLL